MTRPRYLQGWQENIAADVLDRLQGDSGCGVTPRYAPCPWLHLRHVSIQIEIVEKLRELRDLTEEQHEKNLRTREVSEDMHQAGVDRYVKGLFRRAARVLYEETLRLEMMEQDMRELGSQYGVVMADGHRRPCPGCGDPAGDCPDQSCVRTEEVIR